MKTIQIATIIVMAIFYTAYFVKQVQQKRQGVKTMILGKGDKPASEKRLELWLKIASFSMPLVELASMFWNLMAIPSWAQWLGVAVAAIGVAFFCAGMLTMKDSWRAGIPEKKETALVTNGIYRISRNPAFVGFDLLYLGILIAFPNAWHAAAVAIALVLFHKQILNEEKFLTAAFGNEYQAYKQRVRRYL